MTITDSSVGASSPDGRMFRLDLGASRFRQGEALVAGGFVPAPSIIKFRDRITHEGGIDVPVPMPG